MATVRPSEYEIEIHYEQKLRNAFFEAACSEGTIRDAAEWDVLIAMFLKHRLVSIENTKKLD